MEPKHLGAEKRAHDIRELLLAHAELKSANEKKVEDENYKVKNMIITIKKDSNSNPDACDFVTAGQCFCCALWELFIYLLFKYLQFVSV